MKNDYRSCSCACPSLSHFSSVGSQCVVCLNKGSRRYTIRWFEPVDKTASSKYSVLLNGAPLRSSNRSASSVLLLIAVCFIYLAFWVNVNVAFMAKEHFFIEEETLILTSSLEVCFMRVIRNFPSMIELILVCCWCCFSHQNVWLSFWKVLQPLKPVNCIYVCIYKSFWSC